MLDDAITAEYELLRSPAGVDADFGDELLYATLGGLVYHHQHMHLPQRCTLPHPQPKPPSDSLVHHLWPTT